MDMVQLQHQIRHNTEEMQKYVADLDKWEQEIAKRDEKITKKEGVSARDRSTLPPPRTLGAAAAAAPPAEPEKHVSAALAAKETGNKLFGAGKFAEAVAMYTESISLERNAVVFANRAMARLKLGLFAEAEADCDACIELDPKYAKAYARRAVARRALKQFQAAIEDFEHCLRLEPGHKPTEKELADTRALLAVAQPPRRKLQVVEEDGGDQATPAQAAPQQQQPPVDKSVGAEPAAPLGKETTGTRPSSASGGASHAATESRPAAASGSPATKRVRPPLSLPAVKLSVPSTPPKSLYEFERVWNELRKDNQLFAQYLKVCDPAAFPVLFRDSLGSDMVSSIISAVSDVLLGSDPLFCFQVLDGLSRSPQIGMVVLCLSQSERATLRTVVDRFGGVEGVQVEQLDRLRKVYKL